MARDYAHEPIVRFSSEQRKHAFVLASQNGVDVAAARSKEHVVTKEDDGRDTRPSNWTLATGTLPGRRDVPAPAIVATAARTVPEATS